ncbi:PEP-CTERM sorting domain-containing protein [Luteolibacter sp. LG18]|uniref:PEP-CTERM sorting domain-containing protein n=1 Tax=Luteolibacter sp. LG18 TaxID=2819286 RepID=UPI002B2926F6|nr:hypothetical protein llg_30950 [Luteolibacter sp. LG18]
MDLTKATLLSATLASLLQPASAALVFMDDFSTTGQSDDVNFQYTAGRQTGDVGNLQYRQGNGALAGTITGTIANEAANGFKTQIGNAGGPGTLWVVGGNPAQAVGSVSPEHNFTESGGVGGYLSISFTLDPVTGSAGTSGDWGAITLGAGDNASFGASGSGARGQGIISSAAHFGILFRDNGQFQAFDGSAQVGGAVYDATPATPTSHTIELRITGVGDGNPWDGSGDALIDVYADGGASPFYSFTKTGGYTSNYLTLQGFGGGSGNTISQFDNLRVETVPEPSAGLLAGVVLAGALVRRRR